MTERLTGTPQEGWEVRTKVLFLQQYKSQGYNMTRTHVRCYVHRPRLDQPSLLSKAHNHFLGAKSIFCTSWLGGCCKIASMFPIPVNNPPPRFLQMLGKEGKGALSPFTVKVCIAKSCNVLGPRGMVAGFALSQRTHRFLRGGRQVAFGWEVVVLASFGHV